MFENDWIMRQIETSVHFITEVLFGKKIPHDALSDGIHSKPGKELLEKVSRCLDSGEINAAENFLFDAMTEGNSETLCVALAFYDRLNAMTDQDLEKSDFSREEIQDGLSSITHQYGINIMDLFDLE